MSDAPIFSDPAQQAHFDDFMAKFTAVGGVARAARISGWGMHMTTDSETITLAIKQPLFVPTPPDATSTGPQTVEGDHAAFDDAPLTSDGEAPQ